MKKIIFTFFMLAALTACHKQLGLQVLTESGVIEGIEQDGVKAYLGIPYAEAPVGELRWRAPQPKAAWEGVREAKTFGNDPMQRMFFPDMIFRGPEKSEDCLYLNVWTAARTAGDKLPVLIYYNGGGLMCGSGSEPRYDGAAMAREGVITVTANYREGVFGFFSHPELTAESPYGGSGNYGLLDQVAALEWVKRNIGAFGGDKDRITIVGESAGSFSVSLLMVSPLSKHLIAGAMLSSGADVLPFKPETQAEAEAAGVKRLGDAGIGSIAEARALSGDSIETLLPADGMKHVVLDGYYMTETPDAIYAAGRQANVPLLAGWNTLDMPGLDYVTSRVCDYHVTTTAQPVYRYLFCRIRPEEHPAAGAVHSADIEYAMGNLDSNTVFDWQEEDYAISRTFLTYYANFCKTGDPNGEGLPYWAPMSKDLTARSVLHIGEAR